MLPEKGADVNGQGGEDGNALQAASSEGQDRVVHIALVAANLDLEEGDVFK